MDTESIPQIDPHEAVRLFERYLWRAQAWHDAAETPLVKAIAQVWIINAQRGLDKWRAALERTRHLTP